MVWSLTDIHWNPPRQIRYFPKIVAHLFSGEKRRGDLQSFLEEAGFQAISVDVIFSTTWGNLLNPATFNLFCNAINQKILIGFIAGPPCETWPRARYHSATSGPRPVRSATQPWGLDHLTRKEADQVFLGNQLLSATLILFWTAMMARCTAVVEHPAEPKEQDFPTIWRLSVIRFLLRFTCCCKIRVLQGFYGALSAKPTDLLIAHGGENLTEHLLRHRATPLPTGGRIGKDNTGGWKTAALKQYPPAFCRAIANIFTNSQVDSDCVAEVPSEFFDAFRDLVAKFAEDVPMGPDCCFDVWIRPGISPRFSIRN